jgi:hypothetical protein
MSVPTTLIRILKHDQRKIKLRLIVFKIMLPIYIIIAGLFLSFYCLRHINLLLISDKECWIFWAVSGCIITFLLNDYDKKIILFLFFSYSYGALLMALLFFQTVFLAVPLVRK